MRKELSILLIDDHPIVVNHLKQLILKLLPDSKFFIASCVDELKKILSRNDFFQLAIVDIHLKNEENGLTLIKYLKKYCEKIVVFSHHISVEYAYVAIKNGANFYVSKICPEEELIELFGNILFHNKQNTDNKIYSSENIIVLSEIEELYEKIKTLTKTEIIILRLKINDFENNEIADSLFISKKTVENHINQISQKVLKEQELFKDWLKNNKRILKIILVSMKKSDL